MRGGVSFSYSKAPTILNEKTATFNTKGNDDYDLLNGAELTVPKY
jgi:hypothetical protein